jgi:hypothetical protein
MKSAIVKFTITFKGYHKHYAVVVFINSERFVITYDIFVRKYYAWDIFFAHKCHLLLRKF